MYLGTVLRHEFPQFMVRSHHRGHAGFSTFAESRSNFVVIE